jgi:hypothetical protein
MPLHVCYGQLAGATLQGRWGPCTAVNAGSSSMYSEISLLASASPADRRFYANIHHLLLIKSAVWQVVALQAISL